MPLGDVHPRRFPILSEYFSAALGRSAVQSAQVADLVCDGARRKERVTARSGRRSPGPCKDVGGASMDDQHIAVRFALNGVAHAQPEQALDKTDLTRT